MGSALLASASFRQVRKLPADNVFMHWALSCLSVRLSYAIFSEKVIPVGGEFDGDVNIVSSQAYGGGYHVTLSLVLTWRFYVNDNDGYNDSALCPT